MAPKSPFLERMVRVTRQGGQRWRSPEADRYYEWDDLHGEIEVYDRRGNHLGAADAATGEVVKGPRAGRTIDV